MTQYQVVSDIVSHVEVQEPGGKSVHSFYKGAMLPAGVPEWRIKDLLEKRAIAPPGEVPIAPNAAVAQDPVRGLDSVTPEVLRGEKAEVPRPDPARVAGERVQETVVAEGSLVKAAEPSRGASDSTDLEAKRAAAKAKLPADGALPDGRASKDVWVEYLVGRGSRYEDVAGADKDDLIKLAKQQS